MLSTNPFSRQFTWLLMKDRVKETNVEAQKQNVRLKAIFPEAIAPTTSFRTIHEIRRSDV